MQRSVDKITFESRREICNIINALDAFLEEHQKDENKDIERLRDLLDVMEMEW